MAYCCVVHVQIIGDRADDHLPRIESNADLYWHAMRPLNLIAVAHHRLLHPECGVAGTDGVVLVGEGRAEEGHDAVAHHLIHCAFVAMHRFHHQLQDRIENLPRLFRVAVGHQFHRPPEVGEEDGHLLPFAFERRLRRQDAFGEVLWGVRLR